MKNIEIYKTDDGSIGLYNKELDEIYHSKFGARKEAQDKFVNPAKIIDNHPLDILDLCYGIGYNTKCAIEAYNNISAIDCVELDGELVEKSGDFEFDPDINRIIKDNLVNPKIIHFYIMDARNYVRTCTKTYDIIFHDLFDVQKNQSLFSLFSKEL